MTSLDYVDLYAGPGGWDTAARELGLHGLSIEWDADAAATSAAAGHNVFCCDVRKVCPVFARGLIASPPCQTYSGAGKGEGRRDLDEVLRLADLVAHGAKPTELGWTGDDRTILVLEPLWWVYYAHKVGLPYEWVALEQVPAVLPIWERFAGYLREWGYSVVTAKLRAEQYGVAQTRERAVLMARRTGTVALPPPTHSRYYPRDPARLDPGVEKWVTMAQALGWGMDARPSMTVTGGGTATGGAEPFGNSGRQRMRAEHEAGRWVMRSNYGTGGDPANRGERATDQPAPTITSKAGRNKWMYERPATTVQGDPRVGQPGHKCFTDDCHPGRGKTHQFAEGSTNVTVQEAARLQTFPDDYPWQGNKGSVHQQVGNAFPCRLAYAVLRQLVETEPQSVR